MHPRWSNTQRGPGPRSSKKGAGFLSSAGPGAPLLVSGRQSASCDCEKRPGVFLRDYETRSPPKGRITPPARDNLLWHF
jgi:hypothetical protein